MTTPTGLTPIPWAFIDHELMKRWVWRTDHFEARVTADTNSFYWDILNFIGASKDGRFLTEGRTRDFAEAESGVREAVGKSYPAKYGYGPYAGALATTFTILTGEKINFGVYSGSRAIVTVRHPDGRDRAYVGSLRVHHYEIHLTPETGQTVRIQPGHIVKVASEGGARRTSTHADYTGIGRIYRGPLTRGCTGRPGFLPDTIDHTGEPCTVHEDSGIRIA